MVDGVLASCYAYVHHDSAHMMLTPIQYFPQLIMSIFHEEDGFPGFAKLLADFGSWIIPLSQHFQWSRLLILEKSDMYLFILDTKKEYKIKSFTDFY